jgi:hypothetical protein
MKSNVPNGGVDQLAHDGCATFEDIIVEDLRLGDKASSTVSSSPNVSYLDKTGWNVEAVG